MSRPFESGNNSNNDPSTDLASLITQVGTIWDVKSNQNEPFFRVFIDINNVITSCDCLSFISTRVSCIHMCMLKWYNKGIILAHPNQQNYIAPHFLPQRQHTAPQPIHQAPQSMYQAPQSMHQVPQSMQQAPQSMQQAQPPVQQVQPMPLQLRSIAPNQRQIPTTSARTIVRPPKKTKQNTTCALRFTENKDTLQKPPTQPIPSAIPPVPPMPPVPPVPPVPPLNQSLSQLVNHPVKTPANLPSQQISQLGQSSPLQSPTSRAIQQQLQLQLTRHLQQQNPSVQAQKTQNQTEQTRNVEKLVALLTKLNKKYEKIKPSSSTSPPSLPSNMNSDIFLRGKKIALEAQSAMQAGLGGKDLEKLILNMLERERQDISSKAPSSSPSSTLNTSSPATSAVPSKTITPAKAVTATLTATNASSPATIDSGSSTPTTSSPLARSTTSSSACERFMMPLIDSATAPQSSPSAISPAATVAPCTTPPSTISPIDASPKAATVDVGATSISTATASSTTASNSLEASSSVGKKRRALPSFAMSPFLKTKQELKMPEKKCIKSEGSSSLKRKYPVVEPIEGYDAAITRMIDNMKKEKNVSPDLWSISSSSEDEDEESG